MTAENAALIQVSPEPCAHAEGSHYEGALVLGHLTAGPDSYDFEGPVSWSLDVTDAGEGGLLVRGRASAQAVTSCARCLEPVALDLEGDIEGYLLVGGANPPEGMDDDEYERLPEDGMVDVEPLVVAALLIDMPLVPLCSDSCKGLCSTCGENLNEGPCACEQAGGRIDPLNPFAVLKDMDFGE